MPQPWKFWDDEELDEATEWPDEVPTMDEIWEKIAEEREEAGGCFGAAEDAAGVVFLVLVLVGWLIRLGMG